MDEHLIRFNKNLKCVFLDCETQNLCLNKCHNLPWQFSAIKVQGGKVLEEYDALIKWNPLLQISKEAAVITKYNEQKVIQQGKDPKEVETKMKELLEWADYVCGHNIIGFDIYVTQALSQAVGKKPYNFAPKIFDTFAISKGIKLSIPFQQGENLTTYQYRLYHKRAKGTRLSLSSVATGYGIEFDPDKMHNAIEDLRVNLQVFQKMVYEINI